MKRARDLADIDPQRICIVKPSAFGCVVQSLPLIDALRRRFPQSSISWVIRDDLHELLRGHPELAECLVYQRGRGPAAFVRLLRQLRSRRFDVVIDLQGLLRSSAMTLATRARVRIGLESAREGSALACNAIISGTGRNVPAADRYWRVAKALGGGTGPRRTGIFVPQSDRDWSRSLLDVLPRPVLAVHAGAMWETKRCPPDLFAAALLRVRTQFGGSVLLVGSADEALAAARIQSLLPADAVCANLVGATSLKQLAALLAGSDVLLCNDSGPMHLADAMGTPVVGLFTCTSPRLSGPQGCQHRLLAADVPCAAGYHKSCPLTGDRRLRCHRKLTREHISGALEQILESTSQLPTASGVRDACRPGASVAEPHDAHRHHAQISFEQHSSCSMHCSQ